MATKLTKSVAREVTIGEEQYKVVLGTEGIAVSVKRGRKVTNIPWDRIKEIHEAEK